jgi:hypothetical protein
MTPATMGVSNEAHHHHPAHAAADARPGAAVAVAAAEADGPGWVVPSRLAVVGLVLRAIGWRAGRRPQVAGRLVRVGLDGIGELLPAQR